MMNIATHSNGVATIVDVTGKVTVNNVPRLLKSLMELLKGKKAPCVIVNLTGVGYIDTAGVACLVEALKVSRELKLGFALFGLSLKAKEVFELSRLTSVFELYGTEEEALRRTPYPSGVAN